MRILIGIIACQRDYEYGRRRFDGYWGQWFQSGQWDWTKRVSNYWLKDSTVDHIIFLGRECQQKKVDEVILNVPDGWVDRGTIDKTRGMIKYALEHDYDYLFKCDIDTFVNVPRLLESGFEKYPWSGYGEPYGGTGYWLDKKTMQLLLEKATPLGSYESEDSWVARNLKREGVPLHQDSRYHSLTRLGPDDLITAHWYMDGDRIIRWRERLDLFCDLWSKQESTSG